MKKLVPFFIGLLLISGLSLQAQEKKKSPPKTTEGKVGETTIVINYHSPSVRGRTIFGGLEEWGKVWRAGANEATTMEFSQDVNLNGQKLEAGKYAFFVRPVNDDDWELIFNSEAKQWGAYNMDPEKNVLVLKVKPVQIENKEELTYSISDGMVHLEWADTRVSFLVGKIKE